MAYRLRDRNRQIPNGLRFLQPETNWQPARFASFSVIVNSLISHRKSNPTLIAKKLPTDVESVSNEVDAFNALHCVRHGWSDYVMSSEGAALPPKPQALLEKERNQIAAAASRAKRIWDGVRTLDDWIDSGTPPVPKEQSSARASVCAACPKNGQGDFTSWFTKPASEMIARHLEKKDAMKLSTPYDAKINVCDVCLCPLKLKVHTPIAYIKAHTSDETISKLSLVPGCWVVKEVSA